MRQFFWKISKKFSWPMLLETFFSIAKWQIFATKKNHYTTRVKIGMSNSKLKCQIPLFLSQRKSQISLFMLFNFSVLNSIFCLGFWILNFWKVQLLTLYYLILLYSSGGASTRSVSLKSFWGHKGWFPLLPISQNSNRTLPL